MSRVAILRDTFVKRFVSKHQFFVDFGSFHTRVLLDGKLVFNQPTAVVTQTVADRTGSLAQADDLLKKQYFCPVENKKIVDDNLAYQFLNQVFIKILANYQNESKSTGKNLDKIRSSLFFSYPGTASPVDQQIYTQVFRNLNFFEVKATSSPQAIYTYLNNRFQIKDIAVLDVGYNTSELSLFLAGKLIKVFKISIATVDFTNKIKQVCIDKKKIVIRDDDSLAILLKLVSVGKDKSKKEKLMTIRGKSLDDTLVSTMNLKAQDFFEPLYSLVEQLVEEVKLCLADCAQQVLLPIMDNGIYLTGGGSQIVGLNEVIEDQLKLQVLLANQAHFDVVKGLYAYFQKSK